MDPLGMRETLQSLELCECGAGEQRQSQETEMSAYRHESGMADHVILGRLPHSITVPDMFNSRERLIGAGASCLLGTHWT